MTGRSEKSREPFYSAVRPVIGQRTGARFVTGQTNTRIRIAGRPLAARRPQCFRGNRQTLGAIAVLLSSTADIIRDRRLGVAPGNVAQDASVAEIGS